MLNIIRQVNNICGAGRGAKTITKAKLLKLLCYLKAMAESEGFEPSKGVSPYSLSRGAPSATRPTLRSAELSRKYRVCKAS